MDIRDKRIVVTGGAGFIGSHIVDALAGDNDVTVLDDFSSGKTENIATAGIRVIRGSVIKPQLLELAFRGADYVFHLAARPSVPGSVADPQGTAKVNLGGTLNVLVAARDCGVKKVVFSSSCAVYGEVHPPVGENAVPHPMSPYAVQKLCSEHYCRVFTKLYGLETACLRYFNVYGPRQDPASEYAAAIPVFFRDLATKGELTIFGTGKQTRDFVFVGDVVRANILAARKSNAGGPVINIATGRGTSVRALAETVARIAGKPLRVRKAPARRGDIMHSRADISLARKILGFQPETTLADGLSEFGRAFLAGK